MIRRLLTSLVDNLRPYRHAAWEVLLMRLLFAGGIYFLSLRLMVPEVLPGAWFESGGFARETLGLRASEHKLSGFSEAKEPVGIGLLIDLTFLSGEAVGKWVHWVALGALLVYVTGFLLPFSTLVLFALHCTIFTLNNSKGAIHHGYQIFTVVLLAQVCVLWVPWLVRAWPPLRKILPEHRAGLHRRDLFVYYSQLAVAGVYMIAGLSKMLRSHVKWIIDSPDVAVQVVKSHSQKYYEYLQPEWGDMGMGYATWISANPGLTRVMLTSGLLLELFAFLMLINRAWAAFIGISLIVMHEMIGELMALHFPQNSATDFALLVNAPFWVFALWFLARGKKPPLRDYRAPSSK